MIRFIYAFNYLIIDAVFSIHLTTPSFINSEIISFIRSIIHFNTIHSIHHLDVENIRDATSGRIYASMLDNGLFSA